MKSLYTKSISIAKKDKSNLYIVSKFMEDKEKFFGFCAFYAIMRVVDDKVDNMDKSSAKQVSEVGHFLDEWENNTMRAYDYSSSEDVFAALHDALQKFPLPKSIWRNFFKSMRTDVSTNRFASFNDFLNYCEGATVAPTVVFIYLLTSRKQKNGVYKVSNFDYYTCGKNLGIFAYLAHILRDVKEDYEQDLVYIPKNELKTFSVAERDIKDFSRNGTINEAFHKLAMNYIKISRGYAGTGKSMAKKVYSVLEKDSLFILKLIIRIYEKVLDKIDDSKANVFDDSHKLTIREKLGVALDVAKEVGIPKAQVLAVFASKA